MNQTFDAIIIGGGAAGLACAIAAKRKHPRLRVAILEKNDRVGKKLLATGNGRCNLTHDNVSAADYTGSFAPNSQAVFARVNTAALRGFFGELGLLTAADSEGRYYPLCRQASAVLDVLRFNCEAHGVTVLCGAAIQSIRRQNGFTVKTANGVYQADRLVMAAGSKAAPKLGGNNSAADMLKNLGHRFVPFAPALCPVTVQSGLLPSLKGLRAAATVTLLRNGKALQTERGEVQFNADNLSGICVFNLSLFTRPGDTITVDLLPDYSGKEIYSHLQLHRTLFAAQPADNVFTGMLQKRVAQAVLKAAHTGDFSRSCALLSDKELQAVAHTAKRLPFAVRGNADFDRAQACTGGVDGSEIDAHTMRSKRHNNLYICGEAVDICGLCGGYNLHFAFASGIIAGESL